MMEDRLRETKLGERNLKTKERRGRE